MSLKEKIKNQKCMITDDEVGPEFMREAYRDGFKDCKNKSAKLAEQYDDLLESFVHLAQLVEHRGDDVASYAQYLLGEYEGKV